MNKVFCRSISVFIITCVFISLVGISSFADSDKEYSISSYDVNVRINADGSLDVTESVKFAFFGGFNNIMLLIDKEEGEEVEIKNVYMLRQNGYIECNRLSAGQWDANVFSGTYSVIQESNDVKLKVYGTFTNQYGSIAVQYSVKNAIKRYEDVAEYKRVHIPKNWEGRISNINISISLPSYTDKNTIVPYLHGVLVGRKTVESRRNVTYNVPDTVPGEYVEARIIFPESVVPYTRMIDDSPHLPIIMEEESSYNNSDKADLLKARENAAREAGRKAWSDRMTQRVRIAANVFSVLASIAGLYILFFIQRRIHKLKKAPMPPDFRGIEELKPSEVRLLLANGRLGGRAVLGNLFGLASRGFLAIELTKAGNSGEIIAFRIGGNKELSDLSVSDRYLMEWVSKGLDDNGLFDPNILLHKSMGKYTAEGLKKIYDQWEAKALEDYSSKNILERGLTLYRSVGLITGSILFLLGCVVPVTLSIWGGYLMFPVGLSLFLYTLKIRKHTDYGIAQHRIWKELKARIRRNAIALDALPGFMNGVLSLLGYCVAMSIEKELGLVEAAIRRNDNLLMRLTATREDSSENQLPVVVKKTLSAFDNAISSVQDMD